MKRILIINGSASERSSNGLLIKQMITIGKSNCEFQVFEGLKTLPHFDPNAGVVPDPVLAFRKRVEEADNVIFCTPEYIFSIPSGLKNALEWCVSTTIFCGKSIGIITASASGVMGHAELQKIMKTLQASFSDENTLLISGIKGKVSVDPEINEKLFLFLSSLK
jgi:chromate reductase